MIKKFLLLDDTLNDYGFSMRPEGVDLSRFETNPVVLYIHRDGFLPIGTGKVTLEQSKLFVEVEFDTDDPESARIAKKVEKGLLRGVSGGYDALEFSNDVQLAKPGQRFPTVTKSLLNEVSITPIPANKNSLALGRSSANITLSREMSEEHLNKIFPKPTNSIQLSMKKVTDKLGLSEGSSEEQIAAAIDRILLSKQSSDETVNAILKQGESKFTDENQKKFYIELSKTNPKAAFDYLNLLPSSSSPETEEKKDDKKISDIIKDGKATLSKTEKTEGKEIEESFDYLQRFNPSKLQLMKTQQPDIYSKLKDEYVAGKRYKA